jgi:3D (Asp-Asp-Asp) domain-containing protein
MLTAPLAAAPPKGRVMHATAYCQHGTTASGTITKRGVVAADPNVLPAGTVIQVRSTLRAYSGVYRVEDTGSAIKGREIDIYVPNCAAAKRFGSRPVTVRILERAPDSRVASTD